MLPSILNMISRGHFDLQILLLQFISYTIIGLWFFPPGCCAGICGGSAGGRTGRYNGI